MTAGGNDAPMPAVAMPRVTSNAKRDAAPAVEVGEQVAPVERDRRVVVGRAEVLPPGHGLARGARERRADVAGVHPVAVDGRGAVAGDHASAGAPHDRAGVAAVARRAVQLADVQLAVERGRARVQRGRVAREAATAARPWPRRSRGCRSGARRRSGPGRRRTRRGCCRRSPGATARRPSPGRARGRARPAATTVSSEKTRPSAISALTALPSAVQRRRSGGRGSARLTAPVWSALT